MWKNIYENTGAIFTPKNTPEISQQEYYHLYIDKSKPKICPICGKESDFQSVGLGYRNVQRILSKKSYSEYEVAKKSERTR